MKTASELFRKFLRHLLTILFGRIRCLKSLNTVSIEINEKNPLEHASTFKCLQYCVKVMQTIIDEYRDISAIFNKILP